MVTIAWYLCSIGMPGRRAIPLVHMYYGCQGMRARRMAGQGDARARGESCGIEARGKDAGLSRGGVTARTDGLAP